MIAEFLPEGQVWKRVWKIKFLGLKQGQNLKNRAAHPHQEFSGVPPRISRHPFLEVEGCE